MLHAPDAPAAPLGIGCHFAEGKGVASPAKGRQPGGEPRPPRPALGLDIPVEMREHDFMGEERGPFKRGGPVGGRAADQFMLAMRQADEAGCAELADELAPMALRNDVF